jgi:hypothetical protein
MGFPMNITKLKPIENNPVSVIKTHARLNYRGIDCPSSGENFLKAFLLICNPLTTSTYKYRLPGSRYFEDSFYEAAHQSALAL